MEPGNPSQSMEGGEFVAVRVAGLRGILEAIDAFRDSVV